MQQLWGQAVGGAPAALWLGFVGLLVVALGAEALLPRRLVPWRRAALLSTLVVGLSAAFCGAVTVSLGATAGLQFLTGYLLEEALSVDNLFVFLVIFRFFAIPPAQQQRVLVWGIIGAMLLRAAFIAAGIALVQQISWIFYVFGALLVLSGIKLARQSAAPADPQKSLLVRLFRRCVPSTQELHGNAFYVRDAAGAWRATPLLLVLFVVEMSDVVFAIDSIPAIFSITTQPFLVYTSNICALLGLRSLYFLLAATLEKLHTLHYGLSAVLIFIGAKMLLHHLWPIGTATTLLVICACLGIAGLFGLRKT